MQAIIEKLSRGAKWWKCRFTTQKAAQTRVRDTLQRNLGKTLVGEDEALIRWVLSHNDEPMEQVHHFDVKLGPRGEGCKIVGLDRDGKEVNALFSWIEAFQTPDVRTKNRCRFALRNEIFPSIATFRAHLDDPIMCGECETEIKEELHIDHLVDFARLVEDWLLQEKTDDFGIRVERVDGICRMVDRDVADRWRAYHDKHAILRPLHRDCNLRRSKFRPAKRPRANN